MTISETAKAWFWNACDFSFDFDVDRLILIVLLIVIFDKSLSGSLRLFLEELLVGTSHWSYKVDNLY